MGPLYSAWTHICHDFQYKQRDTNLFNIQNTGNYLTYLSKCVIWQETNLVTCKIEYLYILYSDTMVSLTQKSVFRWNSIHPKEERRIYLYDNRHTIQQISVTPYRINKTSINRIVCVCLCSWCLADKSGKICHSRSFFILFFFITCWFIDTLSKTYNNDH